MLNDFLSLNLISSAFIRFVRLICAISIILSFCINFFVQSCVCLLNIENIKYELRWWLCERLQFHSSIHSTLLWIITIAGHCKTCSAHWIRIQIWVKCDLLLLDWCDEQFLSTASVLMDAFHNFTKSVCFFVSFIY